MFPEPGTRFARRDRIQRDGLEQRRHPDVLYGLSDPADILVRLQFHRGFHLYNSIIIVIVIKKKKTKKYLYTLALCSAANRSVFYDFTTDNIPGVPDGMTIDADGNLWIANYNGAQVCARISCKTYYR